MSHQMKDCRACGETKPLTEFYSNGLYKGRPKYKPTCKSCEQAADYTRFYEIISEFYGGLRCSRCGYDKYKGALECHHRDRSDKDQELNKMRNYSKERIVAELQKCDLVCSNCHREVHGLVA